jgi:CheY-like chemotaxis protein
MMPEMSATVFVEHLRARAPALARRVAFMTAGAFGPEERSAVERGEHALLRKPFTKEQLDAILGLAAV